jgi:hypothetical protein
MKVSNRTENEFRKFLVTAVIITLLASPACFAYYSYPLGKNSDPEPAQGIITTNGFDLLAINDLKNAFTASVAYHYFENPDGDVTLSILTKNGYKPTPWVNLEIVDGTYGSLKMITTHNQGKYVYEIDAEGNITERKKTTN